MDIMMQLKSAGFAMIANEFRAREQRLGTGLPLHDFVEIVLQGLPRAKTAAGKYTNVHALVDLFDAIDINGDGTMEFDEFTSFCVDAGMVATTRSGAAATTRATLKHRYVRDRKRVIKTANGCAGIEKLKWSCDFRKLLAIEHTAKRVKVFDITGKLVAEVGGDDSSTALPLTPRANERHQQRREQESHASNRSRSADASDDDRDRCARTRHSDRLSSPVTSSTSATHANSEASSSNSSGTRATSSSVAEAGSTTGVFILDAVFIYKHQRLAVSTTDFVISFYDMTESRRRPLAALLPDAATASAASTSNPSFALMRALTITTTTAQLLLRFCEHADVLISSGNDCVMNVWKIVDAETKVLWKRLVLHAAMIMDVVDVPHHDLFVSCDLHRRIELWDIHDCRARGSLVGHTHGVRQLVYSRQHDLLLSAGFEFEAYGWDIATRQVVLRLTGHHAPLVGIQIACFQIERAVTADATGVFKIWDIARTNTVGGAGAAPGRTGSLPSGAAASQAIQLESIDPSQHFARFEPTAFVYLAPHSRDVWTAIAGSATLHCLQSRRVQQLDAIPLRAFYHYSANRFVVVSGTVCSIWDGATGACLDEFTHVGSIGSSTSSANADTGAGASSRKSSTESNTHNGSDSAMGAVPYVEVLACVPDANCKKLVVVTERGALGVFNALNMVPMRKCREVFYSASSSAASSSPRSSQMSVGMTTPTCGIVGLHYCSVNKLIIVTDAHASAIVVIDDNTTHNDDNVAAGARSGTNDTTVLRRLTHIPGGIVASAYGYHVSLVATLSERNGDTGDSLLSLWDFETLSFVAHCAVPHDVNCDVDDSDRATASVSSRAQQPIHDHALHLLEFWDEFPVLLSANTVGRIFFFATMPFAQYTTGQLLHAFANDDAGGNTATAASNAGSATIGSDGIDTGATQRAHNSSTRVAERGARESAIAEEDGTDMDNDDTQTPASAVPPQTFLTETTQAAAKKLLRWRTAKPSALASSLRTNDDPQQQQRQYQQQQTTACAVTSMKVVFDDAHSRYVLVTGDERGVVRFWDLSAMIARLVLAKIPASKCKSLRRGYHPKAMFTRDYTKDASTSDATAHTTKCSSKQQQTYSNSSESDWRTALLAGDALDPHHPLSQNDLKRLSRRRLALKKRPAALLAPSLGLGTSSGNKALVTASSAASRVAQQTATAVAAAEAFVRSSRRAGLSSSTWSGRTARDRQDRHAQFPHDIALVRAWQAHTDGITSLDVSTHPNIVTTCALDLRVFVWSWHGACLGKLFGAETIGRAPTWRFTNDDSKREVERHALVTRLLRDLELSPLERARRRRATLYDEHTARKSVQDLACVNTLVLDHIISKHPELTLLAAPTTSECDGLNGSTNADAGKRCVEAAARDRSALDPTTQALHSDERITTPVPGGSAAPASPLQDVASSSQSASLLPTDSHSVRMHCLSQVGPLLCVNKVANSAQPLVAASLAPFVATDDDVHMGKQHLEHELSTSLSTSLSNEGVTHSRSRSGDRAVELGDVQHEIQAAYGEAKATLASRVAFERKAAAMYTNMELVKHRSKRPLSSSVGASRTAAAATATDAQLAKLLEPSEFLKQHIPATKLTHRPQTAPSSHKRLQQLNATSLTPVLSHARLHEPSSNAARDAVSSDRLRTPADVRTTAVADMAAAPISSSLHNSSSSPALGNSRLSVALNRRKSSLDLDFLEEVKRHAKRAPSRNGRDCGLPPSGTCSPNNSSTGADIATTKRTSVLGQAAGRGTNCINNNSAAHTRRDSNSSGLGLDSSGDGSKSNSSDARSLHKLCAINDILAKAQAYCSDTPSSLALSTRPSTAPLAREQKLRGSNSSSSSNMSKPSETPDRHAVTSTAAAVVPTCTKGDSMHVRGRHCAADNNNDTDGADNENEGDDAFDTEATVAVVATDTDARADKDATTRAHLEATKRKMAQAMRDSERSRHCSSMTEQARQSFEVQQKTRRMENYLQQKRRELNSNIGNVFKRTSFAFESKAADDPAALLLLTGGSRSGSRGSRTTTGDSRSTGASRGDKTARTKTHKSRPKTATTATTVSTAQRTTAERDKSATTVFGIYGVREVMAVIRLFWTMDDDGSGAISLHELLQYKHFFEKLGYTDMTTVFQAIDKDGNGHVSLKELLSICFQYATKYQVDAMLTLAKVGNVRAFLQGDGSLDNSNGSSNGSTAGGGGATSKSSDPVIASLSSETRDELLAIFRVFDKDGDGGVSVQEIMAALRVDDDDVIASVMAEQANKRTATSSPGSLGTRSLVYNPTVPSGITKDDVERLYREFDADRNAVLDFSEFVQLMHVLYGPQSSVYFR